MFSVFANTIKLLNSLTSYFMITEARLHEIIAAEKQQFEDYKTSKQSEINGLNVQLTDANATITDLQNQLANAQPGVSDGFEAEINDIVNP